MSLICPIRLPRLLRLGISLILFFCFAPQVWGQSSDSRSKAQEYYRYAVSKAILGQEEEALVLDRFAYALDSLSPAIVYHYAQRLEKNRDYQQAATLYERAYQLDSTNRVYLSALLDVYWSRKDYDRAIDVVVNWLEDHSDDEDFLGMLGNMYADRGKTDQAIEVYNKLQQSLSKDAELYYQISSRKIKLYQSVGNTEAIDKELLGLFKKFEHSPQIRESVITGFIRTGNYTTADSLLRQYELQGADTTSVEIQRLNLLAPQQKTEEILPIAKSFFGRTNIPVAQKIQTLSTLIREDRDQENKIKAVYIPFSLDLSAQAIAEGNSPDTSLSLAEQMRFGNQTDVALKILYPLTKLFPQSQEVWENSIDMALELGKVEVLKELSSEAIVAFPKRWKYYYLLATAEASTGETAKTASLIDRGIKLIDSTDSLGLSRLWSVRADLYEEQGERKKALEAYEKSWSYDQSFPYLLNNYAYTLTKVKAGDLAKAERMASRAIELEPNNANAYDTYAWVLYLRGNYTLARLQQSRAIDKAGAEVNYVYYEHLGDIYWKLEETEAALQAWREALRLSLGEEKTTKEQKDISSKIKRAEAGEKFDPQQKPVENPIAKPSKVKPKKKR